MERDVYILAVESSCDETAAAVVRNGREVLSNVIYTQIALHTEYGGVVPEIASRKHIEKVNQVIQAALDKNADVLITGDIGHHEGIDAVAQGLAIIDGGHYGIEHIFIEDMRQYLEKHLSEVEIVAAPISHPFLIV